MGAIGGKGDHAMRLSLNVRVRYLLSAQLGLLTPALIAVLNAASPVPDIDRGRIAATVYEYHKPSLDALGWDETSSKQYGAGALRQMDINQVVTARVEVVFDNTRKLWRLSATDTRDRSTLMASKGLSEQEVTSNLQTRTVLGGLRAKTVVIYSPEKKSLSMTRTHENGGSDVPFEFGFADAAKLAVSGATTEDVTTDGQVFKRMTLRHDNGSTAVVLDPKVPNRFRQRTFADQANRVLFETFASDYRSINGRWIPFHVEERKYAANTGEITHLKIITVTGADLGTALPTEAFSVRVEQGTTVRDAGAQSAYVTGEATDISLTTAHLLRSQVKPASRPAG
jgi:hypothetical protein